MNPALLVESTEGEGLTWTPAAALADILITLDVPTSIARGGLLTQDAGATTPATADGELIYNALCPWTGNRFRATGNATRPVLRNVSGTWWAEGTGTQFFDMIPRIEVTTRPGAVVFSLRSASITGAIATLVDGGISSSATAVRCESGTVNIWPGSPSVATTPSGSGTTDVYTAEYSSDGVDNTLTVRKNGSLVGSQTAALVVFQVGMCSPSVLTGGNGTGAFLTGMIRRAVFFKAAISAATRSAAESWVKN
jgi:hypothetical protein